MAKPNRSVVEPGDDFPDIKPGDTVQVATARELSLGAFISSPSVVVPVDRLQGPCELLRVLIETPYDKVADGFYTDSLAPYDLVMMLARNIRAQGIDDPNQCVQLIMEYADQFPTPLDGLTVDAAVLKEYATTPWWVKYIEKWGLDKTGGDGVTYLDSIVEPASYHNDDLIKGFLPRACNAMLFGEANVGKSFCLLDTCARIACGIPWYNSIKTNQSGVLYLNWEGNNHIDQRILALMREYPNRPWSTMPFSLVKMVEPLIMPNQLDSDGKDKIASGMLRLEKAVKGFVNRYGIYPGLIVVDTYSMAIRASANEEEHALAFNRLVSYIADMCGGATVLRVHHTGHTNQERARGSYAIQAGLDVNLRCEPGLITAVKQRDNKKAGVQFKLKVIKFGEDQDGDAVSSCATVDHSVTLEPHEDAFYAPEQPGQPPAPSVELRVLEIVRADQGRWTIRTLSDRYRGKWKDGNNDKVSRRDLRDIIDDLIQTGQLVQREPTDEEREKYNLGNRTNVVLASSPFQPHPLTERVPMATAFGPEHGEQPVGLEARGGAVGGGRP
jgi:hypothetical protein